VATKDVLIDVPILPTLAENKNKENVDPPGFLTIEDAYLDRDGALRKRDGAAVESTFQTRSVYLPSSIAAGQDEANVFVSARRVGSNVVGISDCVVDRLSGVFLPEGVVEVDACSRNGYTIVLYTTASIPAIASGVPQSGTTLFCSLLEESSGKIVVSEYAVATATAAVSPRVVFNGTVFSFWWVDSNVARYTPGLTVAQLAAGPTFVPVSLGAATDVQWAFSSSAVESVVVFSIFQGIVSPYSALPSMLLFAIGPTMSFPALSLPQHTSIACRTVPLVGTGFGDAIFVCGYEVPQGSADSGKLSIRQFDVLSFSWVGFAPSSFIVASPNDPSYSVLAVQYSTQSTRVSMALGKDASGNQILQVWATGFYVNVDPTPFPPPQNTWMAFGAGCCTSVLTMPIVTGGIQVGTALSTQAPLFAYAVVSDAVYIHGREQEGVAVVRSGYAAYIDGWLDPPTVTTNPNIVGQPGEEFASAVVCALEDGRPAAGVSPQIASIVPVTKAFDLRVPACAWMVQRSAQSDIGSFVPFSMGRVSGDQDTTQRILLRTRDGSSIVQSPGLSSGALEVCAFNFAPESPDWERENDAIFTRNTFQEYDSSVVAESSILDVAMANRYVPADITAPVYDTNPNPGPTIGAGRWSAMYEWSDSAGMIHRGAPSIGSQYYVDTTIPFPIPPVEFNLFDWSLSSLTATSSAERKFVSVYQSSDAGVFEEIGRKPVSSFARIPAAPHLFRVSANFVSNIVAGGSGFYVGIKTLYTEGGVLESQSPPSFKDIESGKGRLWGLTDNKLFYTKPIEERVAPEWNYALTLDIPDDTGITTGIGSMDDKVVAFTERGTYVVYGDGPNALGTGGTFAQLLRIPGNIGCVARGSIVECPLGIAFLSQQGFYLLDRGLNLTFIGKPVEASVDALIRLGLPHTIVSAVHDIGNKHVRFIVDSSMPGIGDMKRDHYVWYYETNQWGRFTSFNELQSVYSRGRVVSLFDRGVNMNTGLRTIQTTIEQDETSEYGTFVAPLKMKARTGWIDLGNIDGFERVKRFNFLYSPGFDPFNSNTTRQGINVRLYSQFRTTPEDSTHTWDQSDLANTGVPIDYASEFSVQPKIQKCASMSIEFEEKENDTAPFTYQGTEVAGLTMRIGKRAGVSKMNIARARRK
jgi:hypothetical protein